tara:strand:+ start:221 stop:481 length:261 start_codon:yes stop_codon:yes gene_type:complete
MQQVTTVTSTDPNETEANSSTQTVTNVDAAGNPLMELETTPSSETIQFVEEEYVVTEEEVSVVQQPVEIEIEVDATATATRTAAGS